MSGEVREELAPVRPGEDLDWVALEAHLRSHLPEDLAHVAEAEGFEVLQFPNGSANLTYRVVLGDTPLVVRRPPFGQIAVGAHDMGREYRVLSRLHAKYPRAPRGLLFCEDTEVVGAPFLVSEYRSGLVVWDSVPDALRTVDEPGRAIGLAVAEALADLHEVDPDDVGLADLGRPEGYLGRQVAGWTKRWAAVASQPEGPVWEVGEKLAATLPETRVTGFVHNDFKIDNCQFAPGDPGTVVSVFDWDMTTLGDPLADLGTLLNYWPGEPGQANAVPGLDGLGLPTRDEVVERYLARRGLDVDPAVMDWYEAFGCWKTAVILQQLYARFVRGETTDQRMGERGAQVDPLGLRALGLLHAS
ncbi:phosphotransferase family protein [Nocardioides marmoribigeumensis]|uniref:Aminoglycoside phosphotransferase (APT) family kinase protein n=1 Tax=Nocardioides marmoribigeumensis TaxID=433649 RepID=A0ABU2BXX6_9ACTN|nr:phosphotransferase family protein [Nocardioides marmoribigeumensis]MDR7363247.1 aminoglycoside phosphotransferase (APT) family kinase protein [Nocardioides marmoribigeumensis]